MILGNIMGLDGGIVLLVALVVIFGGSQLPKIARNVGNAGKEFRRAQQEAEEDAHRTSTSEAPPAVTASTATPIPASTTASDDKVTISKADLEALLDERIRKSQSAN